MRAIWIIAVALVCACNDRPVSAVDPGLFPEEWTEFQVKQNRNVDILFVVDDSGSMDAEQTSLANNFPRMIDELEAIEGGLPNVHIGVVSTDVGAGSGIGNCSGQGDDGQLQSAPQVPGCSPPSDPYIIDVGDDGGTRTTNYSGTLADTFSCIAQLGIDGCGFEQPLESMRRALDETANPGFLRDDAYLAIVFITDEDDCSTFDGGMFAREADRPELGPLDSFRCFEYGVECDPDAPRLLGEKTGCKPRTDSQFMYDVQQYVDHVRALKSSPSLVMAFSIAGELSPVEVIEDADGDYALAYSCGANAPGEAVPPLRLQAFIESFPTNGRFTICGEDLTEAMERVGQEVALRVDDNRCLIGVPVDTEPDTPGVQPECAVSEIRSPGSPSETETVLPECDDPGEPESSGNLPCYVIEENTEDCGRTATHLSVNAHYSPSATIPPDTLVRARCVTE